MASEINSFPEDICSPDLPFACIRHYFPRRGRQTETALCASREFHPSEDRSGPPARAGVSLCTDEVVAKQLVRCFWTGGYRSPPYLAVFDGENPTGGSWRILQGRFALFRRFVRERISVAGCDRARPGVFQGPPGRYRTPPHYLSRFARGLHQTFLLFHHFLELL